MQVRDMLGVPDTMRAVETTKNPRMGRPKGSKNDPEGRRRLILKYIREHSGETFSLETMASELGFATSGVYRHTSKLRQEGRIRMARRSIGYGHGTETQWFYNEVPELLPRGNAHNGPVVVHPGEAPQPSVETETVNPAPETVEDAPAPRNASDAAFVMRMDMELFEYMRTAGLNDTHKGMALTFSNYLHSKYLGE